MEIILGLVIYIFIGFVIYRLAQIIGFGDSVFYELIASFWVIIIPGLILYFLATLTAEGIAYCLVWLAEMLESIKITKKEE